MNDHPSSTHLKSACQLLKLNAMKKKNERKEKGTELDLIVVPI